MIIPTEENLPLIDLIEKKTISNINMYFMNLLVIGNVKDPYTF